MQRVMVVSNILRFLSALFLIGYGHPLSGSPLHYTNGNTYIYSYVTVTSSGDNASNSVGFSIQTSVHLTPIWSSGNSVVVKLSIVEPRLSSVSRSDQYKDLQALPRLPVFFLWSAGSIANVFISPQDPTLAVNIKKGIISLFQIRVQDGTHSEIDSSGQCDVSYKTAHNENTIYKNKSNCTNLDLIGRYSQVNDLLGVTLTSSSTVLVQLKNEIIQTAEALETWKVKVNLQPDLFAHIIASQNLTYVKTVTGSESVEAVDVDELIKKLNKGNEDKIYGTSLGSMFESRQCTITECRSVAGDAVKEYRNSLGSDAGGKERTSEVFIEVVAMLRRASADDIHSILQDKNNKNIIMSLIDATVAAQTLNSQEALMRYLKFNDVKQFDLCERFLLAVALSTHPTNQHVANLLKLYRQRVPDMRLRESISEALGAVVRTYQKQKTSQQAADSKLIDEVRQLLLSDLDQCSDVTCRLVVIRTLGNAALPETIPTLLKLILESNESSVEEAAVKALKSYNNSAINNEIKQKLLEVFSERRRRYETTIRSQILTFLLQSVDLNQSDLSVIIRAASDPLNKEFNTYVQAKLFNAAQRSEKIRNLLTESLKQSGLSNYLFLSPGGKSLAFTSLLADTPETVYHMYVENSRSGLMQRSGMDILSIGAGQSLPLYNFGIHAAGLEGTLGEGGGDDNVEVTAGMSLDMIGVSLRPITFFTGQAGLMSAVWNAPSEPVSALQTNFLLQDHSERVHLHNGLVAELNILGAVSLDLSGSLSVSLWNKNAQSLIKNSGGITIAGSFEVTTSSFRVGTEFKASGGACIDFRTDVDFYDGVKMCLQMSRPSFDLRVNSTRFEWAKGLSKSVRISTRKRMSIQGLSYPLPASNSAQCRIMSTINS